MCIEHYSRWLSFYHRILSMSKLNIIIIVHQNVVTRPIPSSSASSSHTGRRVRTTRKIATATSAFLQVPTSVTSFKQGFSGVLCSYVWNKKKNYQIKRLIQKTCKTTHMNIITLTLSTYPEKPVFLGLKEPEAMNFDSCPRLALQL